jgi:NTE family protein
LKHRLLDRDSVAERMLPALSVSGKLNADWDFLCFLHEKGRAEAGARLATNYDPIGQRSCIDIRNEVL